MKLSFGPDLGYPPPDPPFKTTVQRTCAVVLKSIFKQSYTERVPPGLVGFFNCLDTGFFSGLNFLNSEHRVDKLMMCSPVFYPVFYTSYSAFIFHFCGLCERTFPPRNVHKSRPRSPIWYLFSLSQPRNDYPITQMPIIFPSPLSELLNLHHSHATYNLVLFVCCTVYNVHICPTRYFNQTWECCWDLFLWKGKMTLFWPDFIRRARGQRPWIC